jgi:Prokaryotic cytochrome b561
VIFGLSSQTGEKPRIPIYIAWFLIWVAVFGGLAFFLVHAAFVRYFAQPRQFAPEIPPAVLSGIPIRVPRHSQVARIFHWIMAAAMLTLLFTAFLPKVGVRFPWVTYHWIAGTVLTAVVLFHIVHATFWQDFWSIWPNRIDLTGALPSSPAAYRTARPAAQEICQIPAGE